MYESRNGGPWYACPRAVAAASIAPEVAMTAGSAPAVNVTATALHSDAAPAPGAAAACVFVAAAASPPRVAPRSGLPRAIRVHARGGVLASLLRLSHAMTRHAPAAGRPS